MSCYDIAPKTGRYTYGTFFRDWFSRFNFCFLAKSVKTLDKLLHSTYVAGVLKIDYRKTNLQNLALYGIVLVLRCADKRANHGLVKRFKLSENVIVVLKLKDESYEFEDFEQILMHYHVYGELLKKQPIQGFLESKLNLEATEKNIPLQHYAAMNIEVSKMYKMREVRVLVSKQTFTTEECSLKIWLKNISRVIESREADDSIEIVQTKWALCRYDKSRATLPTETQLANTRLLKHDLQVVSHYCRIERHINCVLYTLKNYSVVTSVCRNWLEEAFILWNCSCTYSGDHYCKDKFASLEATDNFEVEELTRRKVSQNVHCKRTNVSINEVTRVTTKTKERFSQKLFIFFFDNELCVCNKTVLNKFEYNQKIIYPLTTKHVTNTNINVDLQNWKRLGTELSFLDYCYVKKCLIFWTVFENIDVRLNVTTNKISLFTTNI